MMMKCLLGMAAVGLFAADAGATGRVFTYTYEPETMPKGATEYEQWITLRTQRSAATGKDNYNRWDLRSEFEYGVTDLYTLGLYLNFKSESYRQLATDEDFSKFTFKGVSLENRLMVLHPAKNPLGLTLYLEPTFWGEGAELEQKVILGQRHGEWKWALNLIHATEWEHNFRETAGELGATLGAARHLGKRWTAGLELRNDTKLAEYEHWQNTALFLGPVVSYRQDRWWAALTVLPQVWGSNFGRNPDGFGNLDLDGHERVNVRLLFGIDF